jgi:Protein of unknown function (DUF2924)
VIDAAVITAEARALEGLDLTGLRAAWATHFGEPLRLRSPELLRLLLAWRIQAGAFGGLDAGVRRRLRQSGRTRGGAEHSLGDGARIVREWRGVDHVVEVVAGGYRWEGKTYASLSAVALAMTGTKRNGPAFFGLRDGAAR